MSVAVVDAGGGGAYEVVEGRSGALMGGIWFVCVVVVVNGGLFDGVLQRRVEQIPHPVESGSIVVAVVPNPR